MFTLLDENLLSKKLKQPFINAGHSVSNVYDMGWRGLKDRKILDLAEAHPFVMSLIYIRKIRKERREHMTILGSCHCGKTTFRIDGDIPAKLTRCTCSLCSKRGALWAYYQPSQFQLTTPATDDAIYRWNTKLVAHHFCPECGCATFSDSPAFERDGSWDKSTRRIGVNARLFDNFDAAAASVEVIDGKNLW